MSKLEVISLQVTLSKRFLVCCVSIYMKWTETILDALQTYPNINFMNPMVESTKRSDLYSWQGDYQLHYYNFFHYFQLKMAQGMSEWEMSVKWSLSTAHTHCCCCLSHQYITLRCSKAYGGMHGRLHHPVIITYRTMECWCFFKIISPTKS